MNKKVIIILGLALVLIGGLSYYLLWQRRQELIYPPASAQPYEKGEVGYQEPQTTVAIGTKEVSKGVFVKVEDGNIFFEDEGILTQIMLLENEVVLACTYQDLTSATELDYDQVSSIDPMTPVELGGILPVGEVIVVFTSGTDSSFRAHTVAVDVDYCQY